MSTQDRTLSNEVVSLIYNVELNQAGWWDKTILRLVMAVLWKAENPPNKEEIRAVLKAEFKLDLGSSTLNEVLKGLEKSDDVLLLPDQRYRIPEQKRKVFQEELSATVRNQEQAKAHFCQLIEPLGISGSDSWEIFLSAFLLPLVREIGTSTYQLLRGNPFTSDPQLVAAFLAKFESGHHEELRNLVTTFLDPKNDVVREYVNRLLHARFCVEASGLPQEVLERLSDSLKKELCFNVYVDTNFLFSLIGIHENPSNEAAIELRELVTKLKGKPNVKFLITPETIHEARGVIDATRLRLNGIPTTDPFVRAALKLGLSGLAEKFMIERLSQGANLSPDAWFKPYVDDFVTMASNKDVELKQVDLSKYSTRQDVVNDINYLLKVEESRVNLRKGKTGKTYETIKHDMVLWHYIKDCRPPYIESPVDAEDWLLTVDYRLIRFDVGKQHWLRSRVPICMDPSSMVQLLQFWVPRSRDFEEAVVGSMRLPFLFQEFNVEAEKTSLRILQGMGRFSASKDATEDTITRVLMNQGLRTRLAKNPGANEELELIKDVWLDEMKARLDMEADEVKEMASNMVDKDTQLALLNKERSEIEDRMSQERDAALKQLVKENAEVLQRTRDAHATELAQIKREKEEQARTIDNLKGQSDQHQKERDETKKSLAAQEAAIKAMQEQLAVTAKRRQTSKALWWYFLALSAICAITFLGAWKGIELFPQAVNILDLWPCRILVAVVVFIALHLILELLVRKHEHMEQLWPFQLVKKFSGWLWGVVVLGFIAGVAGNIYSNHVQKNLDRQQQEAPAGKQTNAVP